MYNNEKVSIIIIIYRIEKYLRQCLESVRASTYSNIEVIMVAGCSPEGKDDGCLEICQEFAAADERFKLITCQAAGVSDARNRGLRAAAGELIGFVDGDDYIDPDMFESMLNNLKSHNADIAVCGRYYEFVNTTRMDEAAPARLMSGEEAIEMVLLGTGFYLHCWDKLYKRELWEGIEFPIDSYVEDRIVVDKLLSRAASVVYDSTPKYHYRERSQSMSKTGSVARQNSEANRVLSGFIYEQHPSLKSLCDKYLVYEYITAIQNVYLSDNPDKAEARVYLKELKALMKVQNNNPYVDFRLRLKYYMAVTVPWLLTANTKRKNKRINELLQRFE